MNRPATRLVRLALPVLLGLALAPEASAGLIFDDTSGGTHSIVAGSSPQIGEEVTGAAGSGRLVTEIDLGFNSQNLPATASFQAFLYANDGPNGAPGTLLYSSAVMTNVSINSNDMVIAFSVPSILVPDTFTLAGAITNATGTAAVGFAGPPNGASAGQYVNSFAISPGTTQALGSAYQFQARVISSAAVPEPASVGLTGVGLLAAWLTRRRRPLAAIRA